MTTSSNIGKNLGSILRQRMVTILLTLTKLAIISGISLPHLGRIGGWVRFPLASILQKIAKPLGLGESELLSLAGYLSPPPHSPDHHRAKRGGVSIILAGS